MNLIDKTTFEELRDTAGPDFVAELVDTFVEEAPAMLDQLRVARAAGDADVFRRAASRPAGSPRSARGSSR